MPRYILAGRELPKKKLKAPCIFCGDLIKHVNEGGDGWMLGAVVDGKTKYFLYCNEHCQARRVAENDNEIIWRCGCESDYIESVGELCQGCRRKRDDALPWNDDELSEEDYAWAVTNQPIGPIRQREAKKNKKKVVG